MTTVHCYSERDLVLICLFQCKYVISNVTPRVSAVVQMLYFKKLNMTQELSVFFFKFPIFRHFWIISFAPPLIFFLNFPWKGYPSPSARLRKIIMVVVFQRCHSCVPKMRILMPECMTPENNICFPEYKCQPSSSSTD